MLEFWIHIKEVCASIRLNGERDKIMWSLTKNKIFSVKSMYRHLIGGNINITKNFLWKVKIPARIKFFMWLMEKNSILTRDSLVKRGWVGDKGCPFCGHAESINHLFFNCSMAKVLWNILICTFNLGRSPLIYMIYWVGGFHNSIRKLGK